MSSAEHMANMRAAAAAKRARPARAEVEAQSRRRRKAGSLDRLAQYKLDIFDRDQLDPDYEYRWVTDESSRLRMVTRRDDYDFVSADEIEGLDLDGETDSEGGGRIRMLTGEKKGGGPQYAYLLKKRKDFCQADREEMMAFRDDMMDGRIYRGETDFSAPGGKAFKGLSEGGSDAENTYVPPEAQAGSAGRRRRTTPLKHGAV